MQEYSYKYTLTWGWRAVRLNNGDGKCFNENGHRKTNKQTNKQTNPMTLQVSVYKDETHSNNS